MDRKSNAIKNLKEFKKQVSHKFPISKMILFGSHSEGKAGKDSDFDLIIVSQKI